MSHVTDLLSAAAAGDRQAAASLLPLVYDELRKLAAARMAAESCDHTLQPTALVHEAYLRLVGSEDVVRWASRAQFFASAAEAMRRILIESARRKHTVKRGQASERTSLDQDELVAPSRDPDQWLDLDSVLTRFESVDARSAELAKLRVFGGLSVEEAGQVLGVSRASAFRMWTYAQAWLTNALKVTSREQPTE
jgi:RNA polymerase sigma factor (TIGR02999 family)